LQKYLETELATMNITARQWALKMLHPDCYLDTIAMISIRNMLRVSI